jgi:hypothetical protein
MHDNENDASQDRIVDVGEISRTDDGLLSLGDDEQMRHRHGGHGDGADVDYDIWKSRINSGTASLPGAVRSALLRKLPAVIPGKTLEEFEAHLSW